MNLSDMIGDSDMIGRMTDHEFDQYWTALGQALRIACRASQPPDTKPAETKPEPVRTEINNTSASIERRWAPHVTAPAAPFGFCAAP